MSDLNENDEPLLVQLRGDHITLAQAVKITGVAGTGGQAKVIIRNGDVTVNGILEIRPGRKLRVGDRFCIPGGGEWTISQ